MHQIAAVPGSDLNGDFMQEFRDISNEDDNLSIHDVASLRMNKSTLLFPVHAARWQIVKHCMLQVSAADDHPHPEFRTMRKVWGALMSGFWNTSYSYGHSVYRLQDPHNSCRPSRIQGIQPFGQYGLWSSTCLH